MTRIRFSALAAASLMFMSALSTTAFPQGLVTQKAISADMAQTMLQGAITKCRADGIHVSVTVLDGGGILKGFIRDDGSSLAGIEVSRRKAFTAVTFRRPTSDLVKAAAAGKPPTVLDGTILAAGGLPIKVDGETIGAIGVSGAPAGDQDEACAAAGLDKVADKLK
jgi:uncharacterized protein GlcG (DUF336 family)